nr:phosphoethanolamine--lipid A transferase [uncultured Albidiferax sp.]
MHAPESRRSARGQSGHVILPSRWSMRWRNPSQPGWHPQAVSAVLCLWMAGVGNLALWQALHQLGSLQGTAGLRLALGLGLGIAALLGTLVSLLTLLAPRWLLKPVLTLLLLMAAFGSYFMQSYGIVIDATMLTNALQTDVREVTDLLHWRLALTVFGLAVVPAWWLWRLQVRYPQGFKARLKNALFLIAFIAVSVGATGIIFQNLAGLMRNHTQLRYLINPLNSVYAMGRLAKPSGNHAGPLQPLGEDAKLAAANSPSARPPLVVLVLGETARSGSFGLNGYTRNTTPLLQAQARNGLMVSYTNAWSCGTSTAASVPCMFSPLGREAYGARDTDTEGLLDVLQHAGLAVLWVDNQAGCKGVCDRVPSASTTGVPVPGFCDGNECFDAVMLHGLEQRIAALPAAARAKGVVVVLHQMGGHGPAYSHRSPAEFKKFGPECLSSALQECSQENITNAYDNTIVYTDFLLNSVVQWLQTQSGQWDTAMQYVADHGESLGENNIYLHGLPYAVAPDVQKHVPWITWLSPTFSQRSGITPACLQHNAAARISHDNFFHSVLGLLGVQTAVYRPALDLYRGCAAGA